MYRYHLEHAWVRMDNGLARIGLSFYAQAHLGDIVYVDLPPVGSTLEGGQVMGGIESSKTTSEITAPISGRVVESNLDLETRPELINESPLESGWITVIEPEDMGQVEQLMDLAAYETYLAGLPVEE